MKKLMFVAALAVSAASFASVDVESFNAEAGVYALTMVEKTVEVTYAEVKDEDTGKVALTTEPEEIADFEYETKDEAEKAAYLAFAALNLESEGLLNLKRVITKRGLDDEGNRAWGYQFVYSTFNKEEITSGKTVSTTRYGLLFKGLSEEDGAIEDTLVTWTRDKDNLIKIGTKSYYVAQLKEAVVKGWVLGKQTDGFIGLGDEAATEIVGSGVGTSKKVKDLDKESETYGEYVNYVNTLAGSLTASIPDDATAEDVLFGTWKLTKDVKATSAAKAGKTLEEVLASKGLRLADAEEEEEEEEEEEQGE